VSGKEGGRERERKRTREREKAKERERENRRTRERERQREREGEREIFLHARKKSRIGTCVFVVSVRESGVRVRACSMCVLAYVCIHACVCSQN